MTKKEGAASASKNAKQKQRRKKRKDQQQKAVKEKEDVPEASEIERDNKLPKPQWAKNNKKPQKKKQDDAYESHSEEDYSDTQQERKNEYRKGGYHPVHEGELYNHRYRVVKKLGWGYFSTVWLCWDHDELNFKALKIQKSAQHYREAAHDEITLLSQIREGDPDNSKCCCRLTDHFEHKGPNGQHVVMVFEVLGENLLELIMKYDYKGIPIPIVKSITRQVLIALDYLHRELQIIHTDLKPENVVVAMPQKTVQQVMESYEPPTDRHKQLSLTERDPTTLTKAQRKRLRKKLKMQQKDPGEGGADDKDDEDDDDDDLPKEKALTDMKENGVVDAAAEEPTKAAESGESVAKVTEKETTDAVVDVVHNEKVAEPSSSAAASEDAASSAVEDKPADNHESSEPPVESTPKKGETAEDPAKEQTPEESLEEALRRYSHVKMVDFGNACWTHRHFTEEIQTRQYRAPEVIVRNSYHTSADIWSCACLVFELLTGDFLFDPQESEYIDRDEDHLALIVELLQTQPQVPTCLYAKGANEYVNSQGNLRHINHLKFWDLKCVLHEKYKLRKDKAAEVASFLLPLLAIDPSKRATAQQALKHPWLQPNASDWEPYAAEEAQSPGPTPNARYRSDEDWEDEETDDEGAEFGEAEIPAGMTADMYREYIQQQMELLQQAAIVPCGEEPDSEYDNDSALSPGSPASGTPRSDLVALSQDSEAEVTSPRPDEELESPTDPPAEDAAEDEPEAEGAESQS